LNCRQAIFINKVFQLTGAGVLSALEELKKEFEQHQDFVDLSNIVKDHERLDHAEGQRKQSFPWYLFKKYQLLLVRESAKIWRYKIGASINNVFHVFQEFGHTLEEVAKQI